MSTFIKSLMCTDHFSHMHTPTILFRNTKMNLDKFYGTEEQFEWVSILLKRREESDEIYHTSFHILDKNPG